MKRNFNCIFLSVFILIIFVIIAVFVISIFLNSNDNCAVDVQFETVEMSKENEKSFLSNIDISLIDNESNSLEISCFDTSDVGTVAIGLDDFNTTKRIYVYDDSGKFKYGYKFKCYGLFGVDFDKDNNLVIYFCRSDIMAVFDENGNCLKTGEILNSQEYNKNWNYVLHSEKIKSGNNTYQLKKDMGVLNYFTTTYSQLVKTDQNGSEIIIYDANKDVFLKTLTETILILVFVTLVIIYVIKLVKKSRKDYLKKIVKKQ